MNPKPEYQIRRPGKESSEFKMAVAAMVLTALYAALPALSEAAAGYLKATPYAAFAPAVIAVGYALSRGMVKVSRNSASAAAAALPETVNAGGNVTLGSAAPDMASPVPTPDLGAPVWPDGADMEFN